jgi:excinuclease UvrABC helicase subunit UvrB
MKKAAIELEFEAAAKLRDELYRLQALVKNHQQ